MGEGVGTKKKTKPEMMSDNLRDLFVFSYLGVLDGCAHTALRENVWCRGRRGKSVCKVDVRQRARSLGSVATYCTLLCMTLKDLYVVYTRKKSNGTFSWFSV